ncbi:MAG TPA: radical SAM protein [Nitrospirota bacterium]|nr:radical SAM protein [Nitrospirota bacterium]
MHTLKKSMPSITALFPLVRDRGIRQLVVQYTDACNARCPQCSMRVTEPFKRSKLDKATATKIIDAAARKGVKALSFTGGEPLLYLDEITDLLKYARSAGITYTRTGTNGYLFANPEKRGYLDGVKKLAGKLADAGLYTFWISIDSVDPAVHESMRGLPRVIAGIEKALPLFHAHGIYPSANLGINRNMGGFVQQPFSGPAQFYAYYRQSFQKFYQRIIDMGFTIVNACYPMSIDNGDASGLSAVYGATNTTGITHYTAEEKSLLFKALFHTIPEFRRHIRIFSPRSSLYSLMRQQINPEYGFACRGGIDYLFVNARDGNTYPCGYRGGEDLGKFWDLDLSELNRLSSCRKCHWECFRDPSEMIGPLISLFTSPYLFYRRMMLDGPFRRIWADDIKYFLACDSFDCRLPPNFAKLALFGETRISDMKSIEQEIAEVCLS